MPGNEARIPAFEVKDQNDNLVGYGREFNLDGDQSKWLFPVKPGNYTLYIFPSMVSAGQASEYTFSLVQARAMTVF